MAVFGETVERVPHFHNIKRTRVHKLIISSAAIQLQVQGTIVFVALSNSKRQIHRLGESCGTKSAFVCVIPPVE